MEGKPGCGREEPSGLREKAREEARGRGFKHKMDWKESKQGAVGKVLLALLILGTWGPSLGERLKLLISSSQTVLCAVQENVRSECVQQNTVLGKFGLFCVVPGFLKQSIKWRLTQDIREKNALDVVKQA